jgi:hypothetical protein
MKMSVRACCAVLLVAGLAACSDDTSGSTTSQITCSNGTKIDLNAAPSCKDVYNQISACCTDTKIGQNKAAEVVCGMSGTEAACKAGGSAIVTPSCSALGVRPECKGSTTDGGGAKKDTGSSAKDTGGTAKDTGGTAKVYGSCTVTLAGGKSTCREYTGSKYAGGSSTTGCPASQWSTAACTRTGALGSCTTDPGADSENTQFFYGYSAAEMTANKTNCTNGGAVWHDA